MLQQQEVIGTARQCSWGWDRGLEGVARGGRGGGVTPQPDPQVAPALPPWQYSPSRRHWVSRTCPPLHTCPREWVSSAVGQLWGCRGATVWGQGDVLPAHRGWGVAAAPQIPGVPVGRRDAVSATHMPLRAPSAPQCPTHLPHGGLLQVGQGLAGLGGLRLPAGHQLGREVAGGREGAGQRPPLGVQDQLAACPQPLPSLGICGGTRKGMSPPCGVPSGPLASRTPIPPPNPSPMAQVPWEKGHRVARGGSWVSGQT